MKIKNKDLISTQNRSILPWLCVAVITVVTFMVFTPSLNNGFTNWDDVEYVTNNHLVVSNSIPFSRIADTSIDGNYHPLTMLSLALNYQFGNLNPIAYHLTNIILHLFNTIFAFFFIYKLTSRNLLMASIVSLFFGIHPMHVESVAWVSERKDVLYVFFFLLGLITYLLYRETKSVIWYVLTFLCFILSCLSKGMAVVFPLILLLIDYLQQVKWDRKIIIEKIPFFILSAAFGILAFKMQKTAVISLKTITLFQRTLFASYGNIMYIIKFFVPFKMSALYPYPAESSVWVVRLMFYSFPILVILIMTFIVYLFFKKQKEIVFGLLFYFASVMLVLQFVSVGFAIMADRYSYLSYAGLLFVAAYIINKAWTSKSGIWPALKYPVIIITATGAIIFSYQSYSANMVWKNSETLWTNAIDNYPDFSLPYYQRGIYYIDSAKEKDLALSDFTKALQLDSDLENVYLSRGLIYMSNGNYDLALADFNKAISLASENKDKRDAYYNRGLTYVNIGHNDMAIADFSRVIELDSTYADAYNNRGLLYLNIGKPAASIIDFDRAIALNPTLPYYYYNRGLYYNLMGEYLEAAADFTKGLKYAPKNADMYNNMCGVANVGLKNYTEAVTDFSKAIEINPSSAGYWLNRAYAESRIGEYNFAQTDSAKGNQLIVK